MNKKMMFNDQHGHILVIDSAWAVQYEDIPATTADERYFTSSTQASLFKMRYNGTPHYDHRSEVKVNMSSKNMYDPNDLVNTETSGNMFDPRDLANTETVENMYNPKELLNTQWCNILTPNELRDAYASASGTIEKTQAYDNAKIATAEAKHALRRAYKTIEKDKSVEAMSEVTSEPTITQDFLNLISWLKILDAFNRSYKIFTTEMRVGDYRVDILTKHTHKTFHIWEIPFTDMELGFVDLLRNEWSDVGSIRILQIKEYGFDSLLIQIGSKSDIGKPTYYRLHDISKHQFFSRYWTDRQINLRLVESFLKYWRQ